MSEEELFANVELNETTILKTIAYLVIQVSELKKENKDNINRIHELEQEIDNEYVNKVKYKTKYNKQKEVIDKIKEKGVMYYDPEYSKIYGELCSMSGANNTRTPVIVIDDEILDYLEKIE